MLPDNFDRDLYIAAMRVRHVRILPPEVDFAVENGWLPLIAASLQAIETCLEKHGWTAKAKVKQIKEKFGGLRIYVRPKNMSAHFPKALATDLLAIRDQAESRSMKTCELCGDPGKLDNFGGYYQTLCTRHADERRAWIAAGRPGTPAEYAAKLRGDDDA
ncbi:hypothetical protein ABIA16_003527 [Sinorhizobium fredii]